MSFTRLRVPIVVLPIVGDEENAQTIYPSKPRFPEDIMNGSFWIIRGQHSVVAAREAIQVLRPEGWKSYYPFLEEVLARAQNSGCLVSG